jgi:antitoxin ParD1/3/4
MTTLNISLPESMRAFIDAQIADGCYSTASEYIRRLVREDQRQTAEKRLESLLLEGLDSGEPVEITDQWWRRKKTQLIDV